MLQLCLVRPELLVLCQQENRHILSEKCFFPPPQQQHCNHRHRTLARTVTAGPCSWQMNTHRLKKTLLRIGYFSFLFLYLVTAVKSIKQRRDLPKSPGELFIVHLWLVLSDSPSPGDLIRIDHLELPAVGSPGNEVLAMLVCQQLQQELPQLDGAGSGEAGTAPGSTGGVATGVTSAQHSRGQQRLGTSGQHLAWVQGWATGLKLG